MMDFLQEAAVVLGLGDGELESSVSREDVACEMGGVSRGQTLLSRKVELDLHLPFQVRTGCPGDPLREVMET